MLLPKCEDDEEMPPPAVAVAALGAMIANGDLTYQELLDYMHAKITENQPEGGIQ